MLRTYSGLGYEQANRREGKVRDIEAILMDRDNTGIRVMGGESGGVHTKGGRGTSCSDGRRRGSNGKQDRIVRLVLIQKRGWRPGAGLQSY